VSLAQIESQIDAFYMDFNGSNADRSSIPTWFEDRAADVGLRFVLEVSLITSF
jgi:hypothetical protein